MKKIGIILVILLGLFVTGCGCNSKKADPSSSVREFKVEQLDGFKVKDITIRQDGAESIVKGIIINIGDSQVLNKNIRVLFLNEKSGILYGSGVVNLKELRVNEATEFTISVMGLLDEVDKLIVESY